MDHVISESYHKGTILQRTYRKITMKWSISYSSFIKFHGEKKLGSHNRNVLYPICVTTRCIIKELHYIPFFRLTIDNQIYRLSDN